MQNLNWRYPSLLIVLVGFLSCYESCFDSPAEPNPQSESSWPLDTVLGEGEVRCGPVTKPTELIGGPLAYGQVGHSFRCHNSKIRFIVQDEIRPFGNSSYGGNLIDIDVVRASEEEEGQDAFRELVVASGVQEVQVDEITVVGDGRTDGPGRIRVTGHLNDLSLAPQAAFLSQDLPVYVQTDYILYRDVSYIEIETTLFNESDEQLFSVLYADFVAFGGVNRTLSPLHGFDSVDLFSSAPFLVSGGSEVSYAYVCGDSDPLILFSEGGISLPVCQDDAIVVESGSYSRFIVVGDGTIESASAGAYALRDDSDVFVVSGVVSEADGQVAEDAHVVAVRGDAIESAEAIAVNRTRTDEQGRYQLTLPPGEYQLIAHRPNAGRSDAREVTLSTSNVDELDLGLPSLGVIAVETTFLDRNGQASGQMPAKLSLLPTEEGYRPNDIIGEFNKGGLVQSLVSADGRFETTIAPGQYDLYVTRGFEFSRFYEAVTVTSGETVNVSAQIQHELDTEGYIGSEFHQHTLASTDSDVPIGEKVLENAAEGIEFAASTDHDNISDFSVYVDAYNLRDHLLCVPGNEVSYQGIGHFNIYPWTIDPDDPYRDVGSRVWWRKTLPELFSGLRTMAGESVVQINHPRSSNAGMLSAMRFDPSDGTRHARAEPQLPSLPTTIYEEWSSNFDVVEVNGNLGSAENYTAQGYAALSNAAENSPADIPNLADYFGLIGSGMHVAATGNSDTHHWGEGTGYPRNFLRMSGAVSEITAAQATDAILNQRVAVGEGCLIEFRVSGESKMGLHEALSSVDMENLRIQLQAPSHVTINQIEVYLNGYVQTLIVNDGAIEFNDEGAFQVSVSDLATLDPIKRVDAPLVIPAPIEDFMLFALARGGSGLPPTGGGTPYCYTAPLYGDLSSDGFIPWLSGTQTIVNTP